MTQQELERRVRKLVADGSGLDSNLVLVGNRPVQRPTGVYATVLLIEHIRTSYPSFAQQPAPDYGTIQGNWWRSAYSVNWYRRGAHQKAVDFATWAQSELGLTAAEDAAIRIEFPIQLNQMDLVIADDWEERMQTDLGVQWAAGTSQNTGVVDDLRGHLNDATIVR